MTKALDARDGMAASMLTNNSMMNAMQSVDTYPLWSILDNKGTQTMMKQLLGEAGSVTDFDTVRERLEASWYSMDFQHGVRFDLTIATGDTFAAATISSLLSAAVMVRKMSASDAEKQALNDTDIGSNSGNLTIHFATSNRRFRQPAAIAAVQEHGALGLAALSPVPKARDRGTHRSCFHPRNESFGSTLLGLFPFAAIVRFHRNDLRPDGSGGRGQLGVKFGFAAGLKNDLELSLLPLCQRGAGDLHRLAVCRGVLHLELATAVDLKPVVEIGVCG